MKQSNYLGGLNTLRFVAAFLVIIGHARQHLTDQGIKLNSDAPYLRQAGSAVKFFFVMSGFLLTMLAIKEIRKKGSIDLKAFYLRRVLRIFPLYYLVLIGFFVVNAGINPLVIHKNTLGQPLIPGFIMNAIMMPNLAKAIWPATAGSLGLLWSIGVEEQFYLFFPHMMNLVGKIKFKILFLALTFGLFFTFFNLVEAKIITFGPVAYKFVTTLRFDYMLIGCLFSYIIFGTENIGNKLLAVVNYKIVQLAIYLFAIGDILFDLMPGNILGSLIQPVFFAIVIISVSCTTNKLIDFEKKPFVHWGSISYGMYLQHPFMAFVLIFSLIKVKPFKHLVANYPFIYMVLLLFLTIGCAHLVYTYYESYFLKIKDRLGKTGVEQKGEYVLGKENEAGS